MSKEELLKELLHHTREVYINFYKHRFQSLAFFISVLTVLTAGYIATSLKGEPSLYLGIVAMVLLSGMVFYDLYIHKRVMISACILKNLENLIAETGRLEKNNVCIMNCILESRRQSLLKTYFRYFVLYGFGGFICSFFIYLYTPKNTAITLNYVAHKQLPSKEIISLLYFMFSVTWISGLLKVKTYEKVVEKERTCLPKENWKDDLKIIIIAFIIGFIITIIICRIPKSFFYR